MCFSPWVCVLLICKRCLHMGALCLGWKLDILFLSNLCFHLWPSPSSSTGDWQTCLGHLLPCRPSLEQRGANCRMQIPPSPRLFGKCAGHPSARVRWPRGVGRAAPLSAGPHGRPSVSSTWLGNPRAPRGAGPPEKVVVPQPQASRTLTAPARHS